MHGLYRMFLGDARPNSDKDDWIFLEVDCIQQIIIPASRIALKVHQVQAPPPNLSVINLFYRIISLFLINMKLLMVYMML